ncbi:MAG TPA: PqqD family peptide modification chaperone [Phycisphaerales bacterium]|nr:PqqD family peptide modification chaperone [Phycisphaerales bacterium]
MLKLLRQDSAGTFSDLWYRVGPTRPRLSPHAQVIRQRFGAHTTFIIEDPAGGQYYRMSEAAYFFIGLLDGRRTIDDAWQACNAQLGDAAPTQKECVDLLSRLQLYGLLHGDLPLAADMVELRRREARARKVALRHGRGVSMTIPLLNPEPWLERSKHLLALVFSKWGAALWLALITFALYRVFLNRGAIGDQLNNVLDPSNLIWMGVAFTILRAWHELGHAAACKAMGARCTEMGLMVIALVLPFPYCDTSSAWRLPEVWKRVIVSLGGVLFESVLAAIAAIAWSYMGRDDSGLTRTLLFNTMLISGVTTLIFNLNPLLRYDGYYVLSDVTGSANLAPRAQQLIKFLLQRYIYRVANVRPPHVRSTGEFWLLLSFGLLSWPYRMFVVASIVLLLWTNPDYLTLGAVLAVIAGACWLLWPLLKAIGFLLTDPMLMGRRARALTITAVFFAAITAALGLIPVPAAGYATGTLEPASLEPIRPTEDGFVKLVHVRAGEQVNVGDPIATLYNAEVISQLEAARAVYDNAQAEADATISAPHADRLLAETRLRQAERALARAQERADALTLRATTAGRVVPAAGLGTDMDRLTGGFFSKGALLATIATTDQLLVRCIVADRDEGYIFRGRVGETVEGVEASIRVRGRAEDEIPGKLIRNAPAGSRRVAGESLTNKAGGDVIADPAAPEKSNTTVAPHWVVEVAPDVSNTEVLAGWKPGLRAKVRFGVQPEPLLSQWWRKVRMFVADKAEA